MIKQSQIFKYKNKIFVLAEHDSDFEGYSFSFKNIRIISVNGKLAKWKKQLWLHKFIKAELRGQRSGCLR
ncbi:hypothetical protein [Clostridium sp. UBA1652]|uniref:hypothetical protein n=1 Tax=Clostridium sp. UBA1652 TaxID=1946348 RepID=UPI00257C3B65|nr:hypothetical protein [Clostridium sp. UBA1652]